MHGRGLVAVVVVLAAALVGTLPAAAGTSSGDPTSQSPDSRRAAVASAGALAPGDVLAFGDAPMLGSLDGQNLADPVEAMATTPSGEGYWLATSAGEVTAFGDALHYGDLTAVPLNYPVVGIESLPSGLGYWMVASDGGIFSFGDAGFHGSTGAVALNEPVVGMAATPSGLGYWMVASDGGIFTFGDAAFYGSQGDVALNQTVVGMAATPSGLGYWMVASDGGIFTHGDAGFFGSTGALELTSPISSMAAPAHGAGYVLAALDGGVFTFGAVAFSGSAAESALGGVVTDVALRPQDDGYWLAAADVGDVVSVWQPGGLAPATALGIRRAGDAAGGEHAILHFGTVGLLAVRRGQGAVQAATPGWRIPMTALAVETDDARSLYGPHVATALLRGEVAFGERSARLRGARVGDVIEFVGWDGGIHQRRVGAIAPDARAGSSELIFSAPDAAAFGFRRELSSRLWGFDARLTLLDAIGREVPPAPYLGISPSWDPHPGDAVQSTVGLKEAMGEFQYLPRGGPITIDPQWVARNITTVNLPLIGRMTCSRVAGERMAAALAEIRDSGLAHLIDVADSRLGGCWAPREIRGVSGGAISRHSWGVAIDINPSTNGFGATPRIDPRVVTIFRRHGFAWGGSWARPDGMHFELATF